MDLLQEYIVPWIISNSIAILLLLVAIWRPRLARFLFMLIFAWASWLNYTTAHNNPEDYLNYASFTPFDSLKDFINGWFHQNITLMVTAISFGQGVIALGMLLKGRWVKLACLGAIIFLLAIAPLGVGAAFPFSIIAGAASYFILKKDRLDYLWRGRAKNLVDVH
ncbi:MAG: hypothetical protein ACR2MT_18055 [Aurantibacter sp.]